MSEALRAVEQGERITVTKHGRPVAEFGPPSAAETDDLAFLTWDRQLHRAAQAEGLATIPATL
ncbi:MAG: type II toxin-antitoxin system prevent-host-death family antitoxin [Solirubrobacterales bacterium]|nr:type II toxin-antitoxin system prevent-host-death family antitoxin [Solirubrobacterales bacterium]